MPTIIELGQKVKAKYPGAYDNLSDAEVGQKVKAKYPDSYSQFTDVQGTQKSGSTIGKIAKGVGNFVADTTGAKGIYQALKESISKPLSIKDQLSLYKRAAGSAAKAGLTLGTLGGGGSVGSLGAKVAQSAGIGGGFSAAQSLEEGKNPSLKGIAGNAALGASIPLIGAGIGAAKEAITQRLPKSLIKAYLPSTKDISQHVLQNTKLGTPSSMLENSGKNIEQLSNKINSLLKEKSDVTVSKKNLLKSVAKSYGQTGGGGTITSSEVEKVVKRVAPDVKGLLSKETLSLSDANRLRRAIDQALGDRFFLAKHSAFSKEVAGNFNSFLRDTVKSGAPKTAPLFEELSKEIDIKKALKAYAKKSGRVNLRDLISIIGGAGAFAAGGPVGAVLGGAGAVATERAVTNPAIGVGVAKGLSSLGKKSIPSYLKNLGKLLILNRSSGK